MCWTCKTSNIKSDSDNKTVYKILSGSLDFYEECHNVQLSAWFMAEFKYELEKVFDSKILVWQRDVDTVIEEGLHSIDYIPIKTREGIICKNREYKTSPFKIPIVVECIIPANTLYAIGDNEEVVSSRLYLKRIMHWEELPSQPNYKWLSYNCDYHKRYAEIIHYINKQMHDERRS